MKITVHKAASRGHADHGWLKTHHTFSFANYYDPARIHFGALRVLNDDWIAPSEGFGKHPHDNMEIITIPFSGEVLHQDSMGNRGTIQPGEIQVMSAGTGIYHSEHNNSSNEALTLFQIWVLPDQKNHTPRYEQIRIDELSKRNELYQIISPNPDDEGMWIHQQAWFHLGEMDEGTEISYILKNKNSGVYLIVIEGSLTVEGQLMERRDGMGLCETDIVNFKANAESKVLLMEVPMIW